MRRVAATACLASAIATYSGAAVATEIVLNVTRGASAGQAVLTWTGGTSPYQVHRAGQPQGVVAPTNVIGRASTGDGGFTDSSVPEAGTIYFYVVVSGACGDGVVDLTEACDDGNSVSGDGCSAVCQVETPALLAMSPTFHAFANTLVGNVSATATFTVTNQGSLSSGPLAIGLTGNNPGDFAILSPAMGDCVPGSVLVGGATCTIRGRFAPASAGAKSTTLQATASPGGTATSSLTGVALWPLTINKSGSGTVTRDGVTVCGSGCPETVGYVDGATATLVASTQNGSGSYFSGWSGDCSGTVRTCTVTMTAQRSVAATFSAMSRNMAFVSAATQATNLGNAAAYDARCNLLATAAGVNNALGNAYVAWVSDAGSSAVARLGVARGWIRMDGRPFADSLSSLFAGAVYYPLRIDDGGADGGSRQVLTGTTNGGAVSGSTCSNWTTASSLQWLSVGDAASGAGGWSSTSLSPCSASYPVYCLMKTSSLALTPTPEAGKRIYLSAAFVPGVSMTPDQRCELDKPSGVGTVKALVASTTAPAAGVVTPAQRYVRPDGVFVGTGADLVAGGRLVSGMWQLGTYAYAGDGQRVWTGAATLTDVGTTATTCADWTSGSSTGLSGAAASSDTAWWAGVSQSCGTITNRLYCVEQ